MVILIYIYDKYNILITSKIYCYLRVSTDKQKIGGNTGEFLLKVNNLGLNSQNIVWIEETISGMKNWKSRELGKVEFKKNDVFATSEPSRVSRTVIKIMGFISELM